MIDMKSIDEEFRVPEVRANQSMSHQWKYLEIKRLNLEFDQSESKLIVMSDVTSQFIDRKLASEKLKSKYFKTLNKIVTH